MLTANRNGKIIYANHTDRKLNYSCNECCEQVILKVGKQKIAHFAHKKNSKCKLSEGETYWHMLGKQMIFDSFNSKKQLECYLPKIKQRADVLVNNVAYEYQCSPISYQCLNMRVNGYRKLGIKSFWILGMKYFQKRINPTALKFLRLNANAGYYLVFLDSKKRQYYLRHHIVQIDGQYCFQQNSFYDLKSVFIFLSEKHACKYQHQSLAFCTQKIEKRIRCLHKKTLEIQQLCYENGKLMQGCPIECHEPRELPPLFGNDWLAWRILLVFELENGNSTETSILNLRQNIRFQKEFVFLKNVNLKRELIFYEWIRSNQNVKFKWFKDSYDKIDVINKKEQGGNIGKYKRNSKAKRCS